METVRLFVAIDLDDHARQAIAAEQTRLKQAMMGSGRVLLRWVRPEQLHVTLVFLGSVSAVGRAPGDAAASGASAVVEALGQDVDAARFRIVFAGLGLFPPSGAPAVLWLGVTTGRREVAMVRRQIADRLARIGPARADARARPFHPHLTLARWRTAKPSDRERVLAADRGAEVAGVDVSAVTLYESRLSSAGPSYTALATAKLRV